jgi:hypothetical protein
MKEFLGRYKEVIDRDKRWGEVSINIGVVEKEIKNNINKIINAKKKTMNIMFRFNGWFGVRAVK